MHYKTIMLALLQQSPALHHELRLNTQLLSTLNRMASALKTRHAYWTSVLRQERPESAPQQIASEALEIAVQEMQDTLPDASPQSVPLPESFSLDAAMTVLRRHTPPA
jgi:hypothetical protein